MNDTKQQMSKRCLFSYEKSDIIDVLKEDIKRDQLSINNIIKNRDIVTTLSVKSPDELIRIYNSHITRSQGLLQKIDIIPNC